MNMQKNNNLFFTIIILTFIVYNSILIYNTSFLIEGHRYFSLADDQMISMKYAKNLANGDGLVWEKGAVKVEGYSNLLWVLLMAIVHLLPIPINSISLVVQIIGLFFLLLNLFIIKKISELIFNKNSFIVISSLILSAFYFPLNYWAIHGFEISAIVLILNFSIYKYLVNSNNENKQYFSFLLLAIGILLRLDLIIPYILFLFFEFFSKKNNLKEILIYTLPLIIVIAGTTIFRFLYYGDILPNTYYLKISGYPFFLRLSRGMISFFLFMKNSNLFLFIIPFFSIIFVRSKYIKFFLILILGQIFYSIYVGGDAWEWWRICNRFIVIIMPLFFMLFSLSIYRIYLFITNKFIFFANRRLLTKTILILTMLISFIRFNTPYGLSQARDWLLQESPFEVWEIKLKIELGMEINKISNKKAVIAVVTAGVMPYFFDHKYIDLLGKNDKFIAKGKMRIFEENKNLFKYNNTLNSKYSFFYPGHLKWNYKYSLGRFKPDIIVDLWGNKKEALPFLKGYSILYINDFRLIVKNKSKNIYWAKILKHT